MKRSKKIRVFFASVSLILTLTASTFTPASSAGLPDEQWFPASSTGSNQVGFNFSESSSLQNMTTNLSPTYPFLNSSDGKSKYPNTCTSVLDKSCAEATSFIYHVVLPPCDTSRVIDCIESIWSESQGKKTMGIYSKSIPAEPTTPYTALGAENLITGSTPSIWQIPGITHLGGSDLYSVNTLIAAGSENANKPVVFGTGGELSIGIFPINLVSGNYPSRVAGIPWSTNTDETRICSAFGDNICASKQGFSNDVTIGISIRLTQPPIGWLHGRVKAPDALIEKIIGGVKISISGQPVQVPTVAGNFSLSEYPQTVQDSHKNDNGKIIMMSKGGQIFSEGNNNILYQPSLGGTTSALRLLLPMVKDKSVAEPKTWKISTLAYFEDYKVSTCVKASGKLAGIVSTNSTTYAVGPPTFDRETESLNYELASAHSTSKGQDFLGTYNLLLNASVARCIYGFSSTPTSATVTIINNGVEQVVSTTLLKENNGWLSLAAYGFTFSSPTIRVKLIQEKPKEIEQAQPQTKIEVAAPARVKKQFKTITCLKGKKTQKLSGTNPKCPVGYKKA